MPMQDLVGNVNLQLENLDRAVYVAKTVGHKIKTPKILQQDPRRTGGTQ